jgi:hypothetical protein
MMTRCETRTRRAQWPYVDGCYLLYRGVTIPTIDFDVPVGFALPDATQITEERAELRSVGRFEPYLTAYAMRGVGPMGVEDTADPPDFKVVRQIDGEIADPVPNPPVQFEVYPHVGGQILCVVTIDNSRGEIPAATIQAYRTTLFGWYAMGGPEDVGDGRTMLRFVRDSVKPHGTSVDVGVRCRSAEGNEEQNTVTRTVVVDSQAPPVMSGFSAEGVCCE